MMHRFIFSRFQRTPFLRATLFSFALLDELTIGFVIVGLPLLRDQLGLSYEQVGLLFSVGALSALVFEPIFNLLSDRSTKRWWIPGGVVGLILGFALTGSTHNFIVLLGAFALTYPAIGVAVGLSQAVLIDSDPNAGARTMTRWTLMSSIGDLLSPLVVAVFVAVGLGWSALCWFAVVVWLAVGVIILPQRFPGSAPLPDADDDTTSSNESILTSLRKALQNRLLLRWAVLSILPMMLDEVFIGFVALYMRDVLYASQVVISISIIIQMIGGLVGLLIVERLVGRIAPGRLLFWLALLSLIGVIGLLSARSIVLATLALVIVSLGASGLYPIAQAEAYATQPGRSGTVRAVIGLGMPFEIVLPGIVGFVASHFGLLAAVGVLGSAPLLIILLVPWRMKG